MDLALRPRQFGVTEFPGGEGNRGKFIFYSDYASTSAIVREPVS